MVTPRTTARTLNDVARQLAPHLRIISSSRPAPRLRLHNVIAIAESADEGRRAVLALESVAHADEHLGTAVMGFIAPDPAEEGPRGAHQDGVTRQLTPRIAFTGVVGAIVGAIAIGGGAVALGARGWQFGGAAAGGAMLLSVFGIMWVSFAGLGGGDASRQTFVDGHATSLTFVSVHTDDPDEAATAHDRLRQTRLQVIDVSRFGQVSAPPDTATG